MAVVTLTEAGIPATSADEHASKDLRAFVRQSGSGQDAIELIVEGAVVIEADLAASQLQLTASLDRPGERRTVRVLRHDPDKLANAISEILRRG